MTNQEIVSIIKNVLSKYYKITNIEVTDTFNLEEQRKEVTIWTESINVCGEILASFNIPKDFDKQTINNYAYACLDIDEL